MHANALDQTEFYKLLVDSIEDYAIFLMDVNGIIRSWNKGAQKLKGYKPDEIIGRHFSTFYGKKDREDDKPGREIEICLKNGRVEDEGWRIRKDGSRFWANVVITALYDDKGEHVGFAKVTRDLTERKKHEDELRHANEQLRHQSEQLEALNTSKDEFISLASHQLRTPATGVKQFLGLLIEGYAGELSEQQFDFLQRAYESNDRQIELVNDLLKVARIDAGKVVLQKSRTDIHALIKDIVNEQVDSFKSRRQTVSIKLTDDPLDVDIDKMRFRMVLENIVDNASKYTPEHGTIEISATFKDQILSIAIKDSGVGIDEASIALLFSKFSRIHNELSDTVGGSGLGLYWANKVVRLHDGKICVESEPGVGTTFYVQIPQEISHE
jgi:osomolarity two-component system sensor histidine kinase TcsA